jgi:hypothetical protein
MTEDSQVQTWATAVSRNQSNDRVIIFRYADTFSSAFNKTSQPVRVTIVWRYNSETGQPRTDEHQRMNVLEDTLEPILGEDNFATLAVVATGEDVREWTYYVSSGDEFFSRLNSALAAAPKYPIEIYADLDAEWDTYGQVKARIKQP